MSLRRSAAFDAGAQRRDQHSGMQSVCANNIFYKLICCCVDDDGTNVRVERCKHIKGASIVTALWQEGGAHSASPKKSSGTSCGSAPQQSGPTLWHFPVLVRNSEQERGSFRFPYTGYLSLRRRDKPRMALGITRVYKKAGLPSALHICMLISTIAQSIGWPWV